MHKKKIYTICGILGIFGCVAVIASDIIGIAVHEAHNPIDDTISMLAIGKYGYIQDYGLDLLSVGFFALAAGLYTLKQTGTKWIISLIIMALIGVDFILIAEHNQYAGRPGYTIHRKLVYTLAALFFVLNILISSELKILKPFLKKFCWWIAGIWIISAPLMPIIPDPIEGAYERLVGAIIVIWLSLVSYHLYHFPGINKTG